MSALAGPGPTTSAYQQAQKQSLPPSTSSTGPVSTTNHGTAVLAPLGGVADAQIDTEPNTFTEAQLEEFKEQDRYLPIANVGRIMKNALPSNAKIAKEAKECVQECVSEFISFLSSEAADKVLTDKRKTINGEDILYAMTALGFDNYQEAGRVYLAKYRNYINEHPHRPSHHERTAPSSAQASNRNTPHPTLPPLNTSMNNAEPSMNSASFGSEFGGAFNAFVNGDGLDGDDEDGDDGIDDDDLEDELEDDSPIEKTNGKKNQVAGGKKTVKRKAGEGGPPGKKAKVKGGAAAVTTGPAKKGLKKP